MYAIQCNINEFTVISMPTFSIIELVNVYSNRTCNSFLNKPAEINPIVFSKIKEIFILKEFIIISCILHADSVPVYTV